MATDLALYVMTPRMHRGHMIAMLRTKPDSGFFEDDLSTARLNAETLAQLKVAAIVDDGREPQETFTDGPLAGRPLSAFSLRMQALALADRLPLASAETLLDPAHILPESLTLHAPFVLTGPIRTSLLGYLAANPEGAPGAASERYDAAVAFLDRNYGRVGFVLEE